MPKRSILSLLPRPGHLGVAVALLALLGACDGNRARPAPDAQVVARVNSQDITIHQVQHVLRQQPRLAVERPDVAARLALESLIEQELAAQAAREQGLDRDQAVIQALHAAQREVLARAYQDRLASTITGVGSDEIDRYYAEKPALFAERRIFTLQETLVEGGGDVARIREIADAPGGAKGLEERLSGARLKFRSRQFAQAAEDLPLALLEPIAGLEVGRSVVVPLTDGGARVFTVLHAQAAPVSRRVAGEAINAYLSGERRRQGVTEGMATVRRAAKIEYRGAFADAASAPGASASTGR